MVKLYFTNARLCCVDINYNQIFNTVFGHSDILSRCSFEVRSSCKCSQLETVDLHKILKFSLLVQRNILQDLPRNFQQTLIFCFSLLLVFRFLYRCWLPAFLIRWKNNGMLLLTEWNWHNYEFWNLLYFVAFAYSNHRNIVHKIRFTLEIYACILHALWQHIRVHPHGFL
jgi:hypothetical protein